MKKTLFLLVAAPFAAPFTTSAHAHFLWAQADAPQNQVRLYFGEGVEGITEGIKPEILQKAALWKASGEKLMPQLNAGAYRAKLDAKSQVYGAHQSWGVLDRSEGGRGVFRLEYYAKAATSLDKAGLGVKLPFELFARRDGQDALVTLKRGQTLVANSDVTIVTPEDEKGAKVQTDARGQLRFAAAQPGLYALRAVVVDAVPGELDGKKYPQTRTWTTLTFRVEGTAPKVAKVVTTSTPLAATLVAVVNDGGNPKADPRAYSLLKAAHDKRQVMPESFVGFEADLVYEDNGVTKNGKVVYRRAGETQITVAGLAKDDQSWLEDKVMNLIGHRRGGSFAQGDGKNPLTFVEGDNNSFGQLIKLNDRIDSEYRVRDGKVAEVTRTMGNTKFTISVIQTMNADAGKYLANHFAVSYRDAKTNALQMVEGYHDTYAEIDGVWIPTSRTVMETNESVTPRMRSIDLRNIQLLKPVKVAGLAPVKTP